MFWMIKHAGILMLLMILCYEICASQQRSRGTIPSPVPIQQSQHPQVNSEGRESRVPTAARVTGIILRQAAAGMERLKWPSVDRS